MITKKELEKFLKSEYPDMKEYEIGRGDESSFGKETGLRNSKISIPIFANSIDGKGEIVHYMEIMTGFELQDSMKIKYAGLPLFNYFMYQQSSKILALHDNRRGAGFYKALHTGNMDIEEVSQYIKSFVKLQDETLQMLERRFEEEIEKYR